MACLCQVEEPIWDSLRGNALLRIELGDFQVSSLSKHRETLSPPYYLRGHQPSASIYCASPACTLPTPCRISSTSLTEPSILVESLVSGRFPVQELARNIRKEQVSLCWHYQHPCFDCLHCGFQDLRRTVSALSSLPDRHVENNARRFLRSKGCCQHRLGYRRCDPPFESTQASQNLHKESSELSKPISEWKSFSS
jgi:hypothetical protein